MCTVHCTANLIRSRSGEFGAYTQDNQFLIREQNLGCSENRCRLTSVLIFKLIKRAKTTKR